MDKVTGQHRPGLVLWKNLHMLPFIILWQVIFHCTTIQGWTYNYSTDIMTYEKARTYCQNHYTDLVAIQNKREIEHLLEIMPRSKSYYWIGIRKIEGKWTWVGTNKTLTTEAEYWAQGEPNNKKKTEDCVEIYIKNGKGAGMWNDDSCMKKKHPLCYTASCNEFLCGGHGECIETINNYTCSCDEGFFGTNCQYVVKCPTLTDQPFGFISCSHTWADFSFLSSCSFSCIEGFVLDGANKTECLSSGIWSSPSPQCKAGKCEDFRIPKHCLATCNHSLAEYSYNSTCEFKCSEGFQLYGSTVTTCDSSGQWTKPTPTCEAVKCENLTAPGNASMKCEHPWAQNSYNSTCTFQCPEGWILEGSKKTVCRSSGLWSEPAPMCRVVQCKPLEIEYGFINCSHPLRSFSFGTECEFTCDKRPDMSNKTICLATGQWSKDVLVCEGMRTYQHPQSNLGKILLIIVGATAGTMFTLTFAVCLLSRHRKKAKRTKRNSAY
ncbi:L-selectin-like [Spea bombifrons]|uniref:L-selectin-like n=1 Tax=Spea bombifrons TaxID=233779 RepID=UPI00234A2D57|nr:L-selectin-like [Spea bombifrons]